MAEKNRILLAMVVAMVLGYMPWYNFSAVLRFVAAEFNLTAADTGLILAAFQAGYVIVVPVTGWLGDRIGLKRVVFWATLATGVFSTMFVWGAVDRSSILALRLLTGLSAGAIYVPGMALLSRWFPPSARGHALGAYTGSIVAAYAGGYLVASPLAAAFGWRTGVLWTSLPVFVAALLVYLFVREAAEDATDPTRAAATVTPGSPASTGPGSAVASGALARATALAPEGGNGGPAVITASYMGHMWELYAFWGWVGPFVVACALASGMPGETAVAWGGVVAAGIILMGAPASWLWGVVADRRGRTWAILVASTLSLLAEFVLGFLYGQALAVVVLMAAWIGFWVIADSPIYKVGLTEMVLPRHRGAYLGIQSAIGYAVTIVSPVAFGLVLQYYNGPVGPTAATTWAQAFIMLGLGALLAPAAALFLRRHSQAGLMANGRK